MQSITVLMVTGAAYTPPPSPPPHMYVADTQFCDVLPIFFVAELPFGQVPAEHISSDPPAVKHCGDGDRCCLHNESPADCASTASRNRGCRSDSSCVPAADPCKAASNEQGCTALGAFCK